MGRRIAASITAGVIIFSIASCVRPTLVFDSYGTEVPVRLREHRDGDTVTFTVKLSDNVVVSHDRQAVFVRTVGDCESIVVGVYRGEAPTVERSIDPVGAFDRVAYQIPVPPNGVFNAVRIEVTLPAENFEISAAGMAWRLYGVELGVETFEVETESAAFGGFGDGVGNGDGSGDRYRDGDDSGDGDVDIEVEIGADVVYTPTNTSSRREHRIDFSAVIAAAGGDVDSAGVEVRYRLRSKAGPAATGGALDPIANPAIVIELGGAEGDERRYALTAQPLGGSVYLYAASVGFLPEVVRIISYDEAFALVGVYLIDSGVVGAGPIVSDLTSIADYSIDAWRSADYEIFRWNRYPSILIFDTRSYAIQAAMFRRLSFFVERHEYAGTILTDTQIGRRRGWNAHDYRAIDLARFFTLATDETLNGYEETLRDLLVDYGVINRTSVGYEAVEGAGILSISRESSPQLRELFLNHEAYHALFFADPGYREIVFALWQNLDDPTREFFRRFLESRFYNSEDEYLVVNEVQAYLLQQQLESVSDYFLEWAVPKFKADMPEYAEQVDRFVRRDPAVFYRMASALVDSRWNSMRVRPGALLCLTEAEGR